MFKKTFYTFLALGAIIIIGSVTSGFISTTATTGTSVETTIEAEMLSGGRWIGGRVASNGQILSPGTGNWTVTQDYRRKGRYIIKANSGSIKFSMGTSMGDDKLIYTIEDKGEMKADVLSSNGSQIVNGDFEGFSFMAYVED